MTGIDSITFSAPGIDPVTVTGDEFEEATATLKRNVQLSFDVGGQRPSGLKLGFTGTLAIDRQLLKGEECVVHVLDENGEIIVDAHATVVSVAFVDKRDKDGFVVSTTREHKLALDA